MSSTDRSRSSRLLAIAFIAAAGVSTSLCLWRSGRQLESLRFKSTSGRIVAIAATRDPLASGMPPIPKTSTLAVRYRYTAGGRTYESDQYRLAQWPFGTRRANAFVQQHPPGSEIPVFYDPRDPARSILCRGLEGVDLFGMLGVSVLCLGAAFTGAITWGPQARGGNAGRAPRWGPWGMSGLAFIISAMVALQYYGLFRGEHDPPLEAMYWVWAGSIGIATATYALGRARERLQTAAVG